MPEHNSSVVYNRDVHAQGMIRLCDTDWLNKLSQVNDR